jgi:chaperonin GroEL (HSP60 family)
VDALNSVQTAKRHGIIAGGGVTYWRLAELLESYEGSNAVGVKLLGRALRAPRRKLEQGWKGGLGGCEW